MIKLYIDFISKELSIAPWQVEHTIELFQDGATIPFISRYRKERTGSLDEVQIFEIKQFYQKFEELEKRKKSVIESIDSQGKLTEELLERIGQIVDIQQLEDLYLPFRPKRKTRASIAKSRGLEPLAEKLLSGRVNDIFAEAKRFIIDEVPDVETALCGARDIIAERISDTEKVRGELRGYMLQRGYVTSKESRSGDKVEEAYKFKNYFDYNEKVTTIPSHRILAILRASSLGVLNAKIDINSDTAHTIIKRNFIPSNINYSKAQYEQIELAVDDSYKRLIHPSLENEIFNILKEKADVEAIRVFGDNLRQLLLSPPVGQKRTLAIDPGFRTGCKVVCLDAQGKLLANETIYPHPPVNEKIQAMKKISRLVESHKIEVIAIGNGTAGRETEAFIKRIALPREVRVYSVSEDGASVYSASAISREEFPDYDVTVRGAVSIGRRLMDPLAELVKIDPKSIGVGQYQHDVDQKMLKEKLDSTVESCVNSVGVNLNTASKHLLSYVSGIGPQLAAGIVEYRENNGPFASREEIKNVKRVGDKVFEQCAGFLRIPTAENPLDNSAVHPERYDLVRKIAADCGVSIKELIDNEDVRSTIKLDRYVDEKVGLPTLNDIMAELAKPGRDPRSIIKVFEFSDEVQSLEDVKPGMVLPGIVTNITNFGAFVDIGIKQNGLIHISQLSDSYVSNPADILKIHQQLQVKVLSVDYDREKIALTLKGL